MAGDENNCCTTSAAVEQSTLETQQGIYLKPTTHTHTTNNPPPCNPPFPLLSLPLLLSLSGGGSNAWTGDENTNYFFDVRHEYLNPMLDRFAQFFIHPLFTPSATDREIQAVHNEDAKNKLADVWRSSQLMNHLALPTHPYHKFGTGNAETLRDRPKREGVDVREGLLAFHKRWYSSDLMRLCVLGREGLDELEGWVRELFSGIENKQLSPPTFGQHIFDLSEAGQLYRSYIHMVPVKDLRSLNLLFTLPSIDALYREKPTFLVCHLLGHESGGSILSLLKAKSWANSLSAGVYETSSAFATMTVGIELTETGLQHVPEIVELVFAYIALISACSSEQWREIYDEEKAIHAMNFAFKSKESPMNYTSRLANDMHVYPAADILTGPKLYWEFNEPKLHEMLSLLRPDNMVVQLVSREGAEKCTEMEPWYETKYRLVKWTGEDWKRFTQPVAFSELHLPAKNEFIATDFTIKAPQQTVGLDDGEKLRQHTASPVAEPASVKPAPTSQRSALNTTPPEKLTSTSSTAGCEVWWKLDTTFLKPKANVMLKLVSPLAHSSPQHAVLTVLYSRLLEDSLQEYSYDADIAGLRYELSSAVSGLSVVFSGYNHKLSVLVCEVMKRMRELEVKQERFDVVREQLKREYANFPMEQPYHHAMYHVMCAIETQVWANSDKLAAVQRVTAEDVRQFIPQFLSQLAVSELVHGNMTAEDAEEIAAIVVRELKFVPLPAYLLPDLRTVKLQPGVRYLHSSPVLNPAEVNSAVDVAYQIGEDAAATAARADLFGQMVRDSAFNQLRTIEQLGYHVWSSVQSNRGVLSFRLLVQSSNKHPDELEERVESFLHYFRDEMAAMDDAMFDRHRQAVIAKLEEKDKTLTGETNRHWTEISNRRYRFAQRKAKVDVLRATTKEQILDFYDRYVGVGQGTRAKISGRIEGRGASKGKGGKKVVANGVDGSVEEKEERVEEDQPAEAHDASEEADGEDDEDDEDEDGEDDGEYEGEEDDDEEDGADKPAPAATNGVKEKVELKSAPADNTPIVQVEDFPAFKRSMSLYPCLV